VDTDPIVQEAIAELNEEARRQAVEDMKAILRAHQLRRPWWHYVIPFTIKIEWRT
jgi:hypothetical protein